MRKELAKSYSPKDFEDKIYAYWMDNHCFHAEVDRTKNPYTIVIPLRTSPVSCIWDMRWTKPCRIF